MSEYRDGVNWAKLVEKIRKELTSGDGNVAELTNSILKAIRDRLPSGGSASEATLSALKDKLTPILKGSVFNTSVSANTNMFASSLTPTYSPSLFRIYVCFDASGVLSLVRTRGTVTVAEQLNAGNALTANAAYLFDVLVEGGESINLQYSVAATALCVKVYEVGAEVS